MNAGSTNPEDEAIVRELCDIESGLSSWELDFVESVARQVEDRGRSLTPSQRQKAEQILDRIRGGDDEDEY